MLLYARTLIAVGLIAASGARAEKPVDLAILNVTVVDPETRGARPGQTVRVRKTRIDSVEPTRATDLPIAGSTVDGSGKYLIPGLVDMHVHLTKREIRDRPQLTLDLLLANGVTGVRDMAGDCVDPTEEGAICLQDLHRLGRRVAKGKQRGPRILAASSTIVRGVFDRDQLPEGAPAYFAPGAADEARELVRHVRRSGADLLKVYSTIPREAYFALLEEAHDRSLEVSGHIPLGISVREASDAGQRTIEHARDLPIACGPYSAEYRQTMHLVLEGEPGPDPPDARTRMEATFANYDEAFCRDLLSQLAANGTYLVPTHGTRELDAKGGMPDYRNDPRLRYVPAALRADWNEELDATADAAPELEGLYLRLFEMGIQLTGMAFEEGVRVMVGTDANDTMIFAGFGIHDELERFARAGLEPMDILRAATTVPAEYLGRSDDLGGIAPGKLADFVLLRADPLADISNTRQIEAVIVGGRVYDRHELDALLRGVEELVANEIVEAEATGGSWQSRIASR